MDTIFLLSHISLHVMLCTLLLTARKLCTSPFLPMSWFTAFIPFSAVLYSIQNWYSGICIVYYPSSLTGTVLYSIQNWHPGICIVHDSFHPLQVLFSTVFRIDIQVYVFSMTAFIPVIVAVIYSIQIRHSGICIVYDSFHPFSGAVLYSIQVYVLFMTAFIPFQVLSSTVFRYMYCPWQLHSLQVLSSTVFRYMYCPWQLSSLYRCCPQQYSELAFRYMYCQWQLSSPFQVLSSRVYRIVIQVYVLSMTTSIPFTGAVLYSIQNWYSGICIVNDSFHPFTGVVFHLPPSWSPLQRPVRRRHVLA